MCTGKHKIFYGVSLPSANQMLEHQAAEKKRCCYCLEINLGLEMMDYTSNAVEDSVRKRVWFMCVVISNTQMTYQHSGGWGHYCTRPPSFSLITGVFQCSITPSAAVSRSPVSENANRAGAALQSSCIKRLYSISGCHNGQPAPSSPTSCVPFSFFNSRPAMSTIWSAASLRHPNYLYSRHHGNSHRRAREM